MKNMSKIVKPLSVIIFAVALAAAGAVFLSRQPARAPGTSTASRLDSEHGGGHFRGPDSARVTLVEFGDYQCPSCGAYAPIVLEVLRRYPQQVRLEFHHYPLISIHPYAMPAAMAAEAAGEQGKFWEMHDLIFDHQQIWSQSRNPEPDFLGYATRIGLNANSFMQGMRSPQLQDRILQDVVRARDAKIESVPAFFIEGQHIRPDLSVNDFVTIIDAKLKETSGVGEPAGSKKAGEAGVRK